MGLIDSIIGVESGGNPNATNPNSSATGLGQFIESTWLDTIKAARPDLVQGKSDADILALRNDPQLSREMTEAYANQNKAFLAKNGLPVTEGNTYLAHFAGPGGAAKVLQASPDTPVSQILRPDAIEANPFLAKMTARDLQAWAERKMGGRTAEAAPPPQAAAAPPGPPLQIAPQTPPIFAAPQAAAQQQPAQGGGLFDQMPAGQMQSAPIFFAQRRSPDLSKLRAAFKPPVFNRG